MLAHPRSRMTKQLGQRLQIDAVDDGTRAERVASSVEFCVEWDSGFLACPLHPQPEVVFIPRCAAMIEKHDLAFVAFPNRNEQFHDGGMQGNNSWLRRF